MKRSIVSEIIQTLYPDDIKCIVCGREMHGNRYGLCGDCKLEINDNYCVRCGRHKVGVGDYCGTCSDHVLYFDEARSAVNYVGDAKEIVQRLKYGSARYLARPMSQYLLDVLLLSDWDIDCITFVPLHKKRQRKRGYNQAELLAKELASHVDVPCLKLLEKVRATKNQTNLDRNERMENLRGAFEAVTAPPKHVVIIDDVMTTGSTLNECCKTLKKAGATVVYALTFASVPERPSLDTKVQNIADFGNK
ncbi:MAG: ComF family protein [Clostridiales bacterium]|nr:ComF family protein [Clostridiales bacterium]